MARPRFVPEEGRIEQNTMPRRSRPGQWTGTIPRLDQLRRLMGSPDTPKPAKNARRMWLKCGAALNRASRKKWLKH